MKRPDFKLLKVEEKKKEVIIEKTENIAEVLESMMDRKNNKIKSLKNFKQNILIKLSKLFDLPCDNKCAVLRENLQQLSLEKVQTELLKRLDTNYLNI